MIHQRQGYIYFYTITFIYTILSIQINALADRYAIVVDAGSTGSRAFIFKFTIDNHGKKTFTVQKGLKVEPGLSSFINNIDDAITYFLPIFKDAEKQIPAFSHKSTPVYIKGTAGMRLLGEENETILWNTIYNKLVNHTGFSFSIQPSNLGTIIGDDEAFYAVLSSNYIEGSINAEMIYQPHIPMVGAFDMGGASIQLIFHKGVGLGLGQDLIIKKDDFWSYSWLNFGVERIREKVLHLLLHFSQSTSVAINNDEYITTTTDEPSDSLVTYVENPCTFLGYEYNWNETHTIKGTGRSEQCVQLLKQLIYVSETTPLDSLKDHVFNHRLITPTCAEGSSSDSAEGSADSAEGTCAIEPSSEDNRFIGGIVHPPLQGHFYGMSVYFYALDCIRHLGPVHIPNW